MADVAKMMELAKVLGEWRPAAGTSEPTAEVNAQIGEYVQLFIAASPKERTQARKIFREKAIQPNWTAFEFWKPTGKDYVETIRLQMASIAAGMGTTYRDGSGRFEKFAEEFKQKGIDWFELQTEFNLLSNDYAAIEVDLSDVPAISDDEFNSEIQRLTAAIQSNETSWELYYQRGVVYLRKHAFREAILDLARAVSLRSPEADVFYQLGRAYAALGYAGMARGTFVAVLTRGMSHPRSDEMRDKMNEWRYVSS